ncbi:TetR family transcriptional regulator [Streptomyces sp. NPDC054865]
MSRGTDELPIGHVRVGRPRTAQDQPYGDQPPRDVLLKVAAELFTTQGYGVTTTRAVAEGAGMRQATMYHYFSGKDEIFAALLESTGAVSLARARRLLVERERPAKERRADLRAGRSLGCPVGRSFAGAFVADDLPADARRTGSSAGRSARTVFGGHGSPLAQTMIALMAGTTLADHENPGQAPVLVVCDRVRLAVGDFSREGEPNDLVADPRSCSRPGGGGRRGDPVDRGPAPGG